jgi:hypothetical protein
MAMRGRPSRARCPITIDVRTFGWDRALVATLRHPTLPWFDGIAPELTLEAVSLRVKTEMVNLDSHRVPLSATDRGAMTQRIYDYYGASGVIDNVQQLDQLFFAAM